MKAISMHEKQYESTLFLYSQNANILISPQRVLEKAWKYTSKFLNRIANISIPNTCHHSSPSYCPHICARWSFFIRHRDENFNRLSLGNADDIISKAIHPLQVSFKYRMGDIWEYFCITFHILILMWKRNTYERRWFFFIGWEKHIHTNPSSERICKKKRNLIDFMRLLLRKEFYISVKRCCFWRGGITVAIICSK